MSQDGIEIHFDEKRGYLELACNTDAFSAYREVARDQLKGCPEISLDKVTEINIVETAAFIAGQHKRNRRVGSFVVCVLVVLVLALAAVGALSVIAKLIA